MQNKQFRSSAPLRFKHFSRKGYALFSCLGRVVIIGTLSVPTLSHARAEGVSVRTEAVGDTLQRKELKLDEVVITGSRAPLTDVQSAKIVSVITRDDIQRAAAASINDVLKLATGVDVRQRGGFGVQTDISMRGGNFDQITILLNGISISSPHTGHLSADFPVSPDEIERIEVLEGPAARVYGTAAFNGAINIVTRQSNYVNLSGGEYGYANANGAVHYDCNLGSNGALLRNSLAAGYTRTDGATPNSDFSSTRVFYNGTYAKGSSRIDAQVGYSYKPYGANTFYGASSTDQWESNERLMAAVKGSTRIGIVHIQPQVYWNRWYDHYQWHRNVSPGGENYHKVDVVGGGVNTWFETALGRTSVGLEMRSEEIWSTNLGYLVSEDRFKPTSGHDAVDTRQYTHYKQRTNYSAFLEHNILLRQWTISLGLLANSNNALDSKVRFYPGVDVSYRPNGDWKLFASYNMALRMPTFTDLYYQTQGQNIEGNPNLKPEKATDIQLGARYTKGAFRGDVQLFYSHKTNMIDWVVYPRSNADDTYAVDGVFRSVNFRMNNVGVELNAALMPQQLWGATCPLRSLTAKYAYIHDDADYDVAVIMSKYAMDFLRHKVVLGADIRLWRTLSLNLSWRWQNRKVDLNPSYDILDARLSWSDIRLGNSGIGLTLYIDGSNIYNTKYYDYINIPQPGHWFRAGVKLTL